MSSNTSIKVVWDINNTDISQLEKILNKTASSIETLQKEHPDTLQHIEVEIKA